MASLQFKSVGFVGGGRVTRFLLEGWKEAGSIPSEVRVSDPNAEVLNQLKSDFPDIQPCSNPEAAQTSLVVLAVHPPVMKDVLQELTAKTPLSAVVLSLAPKVPCAAIQSALSNQRVVRMIPNAPSAIHLGYNPVTYADEVEPEVRQALGDLFAPWGEAPEVPEGDLEAYAMIAAMGPTYMWFQWQTLRELAGSFGLNPETADAAILKMVEGAARCLLSSGRDPLKVMDMIPVKPLGPDEAAFVASYQTRLTTLYDKLTSK